MALVFALSIMVPALALGQTVQLPDYSKMDKVDSLKVQAVLDGKDTQLLVENFSQTDMTVLQKHFISMMYNEQGVAWLALYTFAQGEADGQGQIFTKETHRYLFENKKGTWVLVRDLSQSQNVGQELGELLLENYKLKL